MQRKKNRGGELLITTPGLRENAFRTAGERAGRQSLFLLSGNRGVTETLRCISCVHDTPESREKDKIFPMEERGGFLF